MNIQNKILIGIGSFIGVMLLVGWIAINEPARMEIFTQQWQGRTVERGAETYLSACVICHGEDGLGITGTAPALKNPYLFLTENPGKVANDKLATMTKDKTTLQKAVDTYNANLKRRDEIQTQLPTVAKGSDQEKSLTDELSRLNDGIAAADPKAQEKLDKLNSDIAAQQAEVDRLKALGWDVKRDVRLKEVGWTGTLADYIRGTLTGGRPTSALYWPKPMPAWSQTAGGPLRPDEIDNLVQYILNYKDDAVKLTPNDIRQNYKLISEAGTTTQADKQVVTTNADILALNLTGGNADAGKQKYTQYGCIGCHGKGGQAYDIAPMDTTWTRLTNIRMAQFKQDSRFANYTIEQYIAHAIIYPNEWIFPGGRANVMPAAFGDQLDEQDLKDIIAYLATQK